MIAPAALSNPAPGAGSPAVLATAAPAARPGRASAMACALSSRPPPLELADGLAAGAAAPKAVTSCYTPPEALMPLAWPGGVRGVGIQRMAIVGGLGRAVGTG